MKKQIIFVTLLAVQGLCNGNEIARITNQMMLSSRQAFGNNWVFKAPINNNALGLWNNALLEGVELVKNYASVKNKRMNRALNGYVTDITNANNELVNGIKITYSNMFSSAARKGILTNADRFKKQQEFRPMFDRISKKMLALKLSIHKARRKAKSSQEISIYDIIDQLAQQIIVVADTAAKSIDFLQ